MAVLNGWRAALLSLVVLALSGTARADNESLEYAVKAAYVFKFTPFITWPTTTFPPAGSPINLCVSGNDEVAKLLPQVAVGQLVDGRPFLVRPLADGADPQGCQILYVANSPSAPQTLSAALGKPVLTVMDAGAAVHSIVQFVIVQHHIRFDIDNGMATQ
ncbi:MAG TPA: YfiR family protein, partial [Lacipirellulaceae bacterium]|nr:YfiR family protein [Lacipirellulaceae bacterium]